MNADFLSAEEQSRMYKIEGNWAAILQSSVIVKMHITQWWPYVRLDADRLANLGVPTQSKEGVRVIDSILRGGQINLIQPDAHAPIPRNAARLRNNLTKYTLNTVFGPLLTDRAYPEWKEVHDKTQAEFLEAIDFELRNFDALVEANRLNLGTQFRIAWERLSMSGESIPDMETFVRQAVEDIVCHVPDVDTVRKAYSIDTSFAAAPMVDEIAAAEERAAQKRLEAIKTDEFASSTKKKIVSEMMQQAERDASRRRDEIITGLNTVEAEFYRGIAASLSELQAALQSKGRFAGRQSEKLRNIIDHVRTMNVFGNETLTLKMETIEGILDSDRATCMAQIGDVLGDTAKFVRDELRTIKAQRGIRAIETEEQAELELGDRQVTRTAVEDQDATDDITIRRRVVHAA